MHYIIMMSLVYTLLPEVIMHYIIMMSLVYTLLPEVIMHYIIMMSLVYTLQNCCVCVCEFCLLMVCMYIVKFARQNCTCMTLCIVNPSGFQIVCIYNIASPHYNII